MRVGKPLYCPQQRLGLIELIGRFPDLAKRPAQRLQRLDPVSMAGRSGSQIETEVDRHHITGRLWPIALTTSKATASTGCNPSTVLRMFRDR